MAKRTTYVRSINKGPLLTSVALLLSISFYSSSAAGQQQHTSNMVDTVKHSVKLRANNLLFFEIGGNAGLISINFQRQFSKRFSFRIGFGSLFFGDSSASVEYSQEPVIALLLNYLPFNDLITPEIGLGTTIQLNSKMLGRSGINLDNRSTFLVTGRVGLLYLPQESGLMFTLAYTPYFNLHPFSIFSYFGVGFGFAFNDTAISFGM